MGLNFPHLCLALKVLVSMLSFSTHDENIIRNGYFVFPLLLVFRSKIVKALTFPNIKQNSIRCNTHYIKPFRWLDFVASDARS